MAVYSKHIYGELRPTEKTRLCCLQANAPTLSLEIVQKSDFSDAAYNSAYVSDVQNLITKSTLQQFFSYIFF